MLEDIKQLIDKAKVVSFDVFDTLIKRITDEPETVFDIVGNQFGINDFRSIRTSLQMKASMEAESRGLPHADFDEIYAYISKNSSLENIDWEKVKEAEFRTELDSVYCNKEMYEVYKYAKEQNKRIIITSDMYLFAKQIELMLSKCGYSDYDAIYVSADEHVTKYRGDIYPYIQKKEGIEPSEILHIGDNHASDYELAQKAGWKAYHYTPLHLEELSAYDANGLICKGVSEAVITDNNDFWFNLGVYAGGPLYLGLKDFVTEKAINTLAKRIYFMARDGFNLFELFKEEPIDAEIHYLYVSRRSLLLAGITQLDQESLDILPPFTFGQTVGQILDYLDITSECSNNLSEAGIPSLDYVVKTKDDMDRVKKLFKINTAAFLAHCEKEREYAISYFTNEGFFDDDCIVFDCGWNGSSQFLLDRFLKATKRYDHNYDFLYAGIMDTAKARKQLKSLRYSSYLFDIERNKDLQDKVRSAIVLLELFFGSPEESVHCYNNEGVVFEQDGYDLSYRKRICDGIIGFVKFAEEFCKKYNIHYSEETALSPIIRLINDPTAREAVNIGNLTNVDGFAKQKGLEKYVAKLDMDTLNKNPNIEVYWHRGLFKRTDISDDVKKRIAKRDSICIKTSKSGFTGSAIDRVQSLSAKVKNKLYMYYLNHRPDDYDNWIKNNESDNSYDETFEYNPLISVVVPVYNVIDSQLTDCIDSVSDQVYKNWELILVDDHSTMPSVGVLLKKYEKNDKITVHYRSENGHISKATNDGINLAKGEFVAFMDCDDVIAPNALYEFVKLLNQNPELDFIYSDEDKLTEDGKKRHLPFFKPDWSPDTFMSLMYTNHLAIYRKSVLDKTGGLRTEFNGTQDYDFTLRFMEFSDNKRVGHIPKVLYHWRERPESIASTPEAKPYALEAMSKAKEECLARRGLTGYTEFVDDMFQYRVVYTNPENPLVSIIIPSKDNPALLKQCIDSLTINTSYKNYELIIIDNGSNDTNKDVISRYLMEKGASYHYEPMPFNFSRMCNIGASIAKGELLLFLNDDIEIIDGKWLERMVGHASLDYIGAVGAKLLYPNSNTIQHVGVTNLVIGPSHMLMGFSDDYPVYFGRNRMDYNSLCVTAACLMVNKIKFMEINEFDENLQIAYNDVDLCFKLYEKGYYNVVRNDVILYHHESASRGSDDNDPEKQKRLVNERNLLYKNHPELLGKDPFYNINLAGNRVDFSYTVEETTNGVNSFAGVYKPLLYPYAHIKTSYDRIKIADNKIVIEGWMYYGGSFMSNNSQFRILLKGKDCCYMFNTTRQHRPDVAMAFNNQASNTGFRCVIPIDKLDPEVKEYRLGVMMIDPIMNSKRVCFSDKIINTKQ